MKYVKVLIFIMYLFIYGYSVHKTSVAPDEIIWGYICVGVFGFLFIWLVSIVVEFSRKNSEEN
jgi:hypothetical protein